MVNYSKDLGCRVGVGTYKSSSGEMNTSLRLIIYAGGWYICEQQLLHVASETYILMLDVLEELELTVSSLAQYWGTEWLHNLLDSNRSRSELILRRAFSFMSVMSSLKLVTYQTRPNAPTDISVSLDINKIEW